ncbi:hypothetical protein [Salinisphaera orenii]|uniref:Uncharacterized protein n=1 Tax=Salinisphaera orenii YIM 95161 TaxID=1051139 RepID=A0A423PRQ8_9GAMM|nr:hypothetical protein [Salinisphaera halophila]ROO28267.1 hypothetical protein SAHL_10695 [Salinisphaera halophila YIM 95161]
MRLLIAAITLTMFALGAGAAIQTIAWATGHGTPTQHIHIVNTRSGCRL